jgi:hypothetical protein
VLLLHSNLQTYRVIDLLINNNRMSSAIANSENKRTSRLRKLFPLASEFKDKVVFRPHLDKRGSTSAQ